MTRILIYGATYNPGGVEKFLLNYVTRIQSENLKFDFINIYNKDLAFNDILVKKGCNVLNLNLPKRKRNPIRYNKMLDNFFEKASKKYDCIWFNLIDLINIDPIKKAKKYNFKRIIVHAHNSQIMDEKKTFKYINHFIQHHLNKMKISKFATDFWACSESAAKFFFDDKELKKVKIIKNAINPIPFQYDLQRRKTIRNKLSIKDEFVIGNVGRLQHQKNQEFALKIFKEYLSLNSNARLIFVGQGDNYKFLKGLAKEMKIDKKVMFAGVQTNVSAWYSAFDVFLFPSLFEGLSVASLEAQANGLPVLANNSIMPLNSIINDNVKLLSLKVSAKIWAQKLEEFRLDKNKRVDNNQVYNNFINSGYDLGSASKKLKQYFLNMLNEKGN